MGKKIDVSELQIERKIGTGAFKTAYTVFRRPDIVLLRVDNPHGHSFDRADLAHELKNMKKLASHGIPTPAVIAKGTHGGFQALVMERYVASSKTSYTGCQKQRRQEVKELMDVVDDVTVQGLYEIGERLIETRLWIDDLQFLYAANGSVVVSDPMRVENVDRLAHDASDPHSYLIDNASEIADEIGFCKALMELRKRNDLPSGAAFSRLVKACTRRLSPKLAVTVSYVR